MTELPYGTCPNCGSPGVSRERRPYGNYKCENGHTYLSGAANTRVVKKVSPDGIQVHTAMSSLKAGDSFTLDDQGRAGSVEDGSQVYTAVSDAYLRDGVWGIDV